MSIKFVGMRFLILLLSTVNFCSASVVQNEISSHFSGTKLSSKESTVKPNVQKPLKFAHLNRRFQCANKAFQKMRNLPVVISNVFKQKSEPIRVVITGAAGQIAYSLIYQVGKGDVFGYNQPLILHLLDITPMMGVLEGVVMEIQDCALPLIRGIVATDKPDVAFKDVDAAFMVGSMPRKQGMERKDLLAANVKIFKVQGDALDKFAKKTVKVLVVGNPANTNALICSRYAKSIPKENFSAMTRLDENRAKASIANRLGIPVQDVKNVIIWGNHSSTQFPDVQHAIAQLPGGAQPVPKAINNDKWLKEDFIKEIQVRGAAVIAARKMSSAMSAAKAATDHMRDIWQGTAPGQWVSMGVISDGSYNIEKDIVFSFPVTIQNKQWKIVQGLSIDQFARGKLDITQKELLEERTEAETVCHND